MSTKYIASNWRLPNEENSNKSDNYGLSFDGSEFINCGSSSALLTTGAFSVSFWMKTTVTANDALVLMDDYSAGNRNWQIVHLSSGNVIRFYVFGSPNAFVLANTSINDGNWHHVVCTYEPSTALRIYIDGSLDNSNTTSIPATRNNSAANLRIGKDDFNAYYTGDISEVAVFDYTLSESQISTLYGSSSLGAGNPMALKPAPVAFYNLGDNTSGGLLPNPSPPPTNISILTQPNEAVEDASVFEFDSAQVDPSVTLTELGISNEFSVSAWVNADTITSFRGPLGATDGSNWVNGFGIYIDANKWKFFVKYANRITSDTTITVDTWFHLVGTFSSSGTGKLYVNGIKEGTDITGVTLSGLDTNFGIGKVFGGGGPFQGKITNVQIWNKELIASEVTTLYNSGQPLMTGTQPQEANLKGWYKLDQSANWEADSSGAWQIPDNRSAYPQSFDFNGSNQRITTTSPYSLGITDAITVSAWVKIPTTNTGGASPYIQTIASEDAVGGSNRNWTLYWRHQATNNKYFLFRVWHTDGTFTSVQSTGIVPNDGKWHHIMGTFDGTTDANGLKLYVDNTLFQTTANSTGIRSTLGVKPSIGSAENANVYFFEGNISNVSIWDSVQNINDIYNNGTPALSYTNTPTAWYKLDNTATFSTNWSIPDASGNGNTGTSSGMTEQNLVNNNVSVLNGESSGMTSASLVLSDLTRAVPYDNYSFKFDAASTDYFNCGSGIGTLIGEDYTGGMAISLWFKADVTNSDDGLFKFNGSSSFGEISMAIYNNNLELRIKGASEMTSAFTDTDSWHHLLINLIGPSGANQVYLDGEAIGSTFTYSSGGLDLNGEDLIIGYYYTTSYPFDGNINNFAVFDEALSTTEILKLYSNGTPQDLENFTPQPIGWYPMGSNSFWNGTSWNIRDMINSNDGTSTNIGADGLQGNSPRSEANGTGTNMDVPSNLEGSTKWSENNSWSINMSSTARVEDTP